MIYLLHGENELQRHEALQEVIADTGLDAEFRSLNTEVLEGTQTVGELRRACSVIPFLGGARVVIVRGAMRPLKGDAAREVADYFPNVPETTHLILDEPRALPGNHIILKAVNKLKGQVIACTLPKDRDLPRWITERTAQHGGRIERPAAALLAQNLGAKLRLLDQEIQKLLLYCGERPAITIDDVRLMVPYVQNADVIFEMVDALGLRNPRTAAIYLHRMLDNGEPPLLIFGMVVRQFRLLIQVRWLLDRRYPQQEIVKRLSLHPYVGRKISTQATRFDMRQLRRAYGLLVESDLAIKRGELPPEAALDLLVAQLTQL